MLTLPWHRQTNFGLRVMLLPRRAGHQLSAKDLD
jgi:hypothetical protein